jgi:hypothetical protein
VLGVDADPGLDRHRHVVTAGRGDRRVQDHLQPVPLPGQGCAATLAGDLGHRAAEVQVHVADAVLSDQDLGGLSHGHRVHAVQLHRPDRLTRVELQHLQGFPVPRHDTARRDHLADVQPGTLLAAELAVGGVRDAGHRREHHRGGDGDRPHPQRPVSTGGRRGDHGR